MKKISLVLLSLVLLSSVCFSLTGCNSTDITVRPNDYDLDYWISETVDINDIDASKIYEKSDEKVVYLDSNYSFQSNTDGAPIFPKEYVRYIFSFSENDWSVSSIHITDPSVKIFGLTMNSSANKIQYTLKKMGFEYLDRYSGLDPSYLKDNSEFRIYPTYISIDYFGNGTTNVDGNGTTDVGGNDTTDVVDDGMVRTVLNGGGFGSPSLPHYVSTEIVERCLISDEVVSANVFLGHPIFRDSVAFSDFSLDIDTLQNCSFSIVINYNGEKSVTVVEDVDYMDASYNITTIDLYDDGDVYKGTVVNYSKYHKVNLDLNSMIGVSDGYVHVELHIELPDGTQSIVMSDTLYYSVTDTEIVFGLVSNPIAHEGDKGVITNGWTYEEK